MISLITKFKKVSIFRFKLSDILLALTIQSVLLELLANSIWRETCETELKKL